MGPVFISYKHDPWQPEVLELAEELRLRGLRVFLDAIERARLSGQDTAEFLRRVVETESDAFLLYLTQAIIQSPYVWDLEVPAALGRRDRDVDYRVLPFFRDCRPNQVRDSMPPYGPRLAALNGVIAVPPEGSSAEEIHLFLTDKRREAARELLHAFVRRHTPVLGEGGRSLRIDLFTRVAGPANTDLTLDWRAQFPEGEPASMEAWARMQAALSDLTPVVAQLGARGIRLSGNSHLSAAVALGYAFPRPSGFSFEISQYDVWWWSIGPDVASPLEIISQQLDPSRKDILLVIAISRPEIVPEATRFATQAGVKYGGRIEAKVRGGPGPTALAGPDEARAAVRDIIRALTDARASWGSGTVHMFVAAPFAFAVLLGHHLNACGPIQVYEHSKSRGTYVRAVTLI